MKKNVFFQMNAWLNAKKHMHMEYYDSRQHSFKRLKLANGSAVFCFLLSTVTAYLSIKRIFDLFFSQLSIFALSFIYNESKSPMTYQNKSKVKFIAATRLSEYFKAGIFYSKSSLFSFLIMLFFRAPSVFFFLLFV